MPSEFLLYGSTGFLGNAIARLAVRKGLRPILAGRNAEKLKAQADKLDLEYRAFNLEDATAVDSAVADVIVVLLSTPVHKYGDAPRWVRRPERKAQDAPIAALWAHRATR